MIKKIIGIVTILCIALSLFPLSADAVGQQNDNFLKLLTFGMDTPDDIAYNGTKISRKVNFISGNVKSYEDLNGKPTIVIFSPLSKIDDTIISVQNTAALIKIRKIENDVNLLLYIYDSSKGSRDADTKVISEKTSRLHYTFLSVYGGTKDGYVSNQLLFFVVCNSGDILINKNSNSAEPPIAVYCGVNGGYGRNITEGVQTVSTLADVFDKWYNPETFEKFAIRMQNQYNVKVTTIRSSAVTVEEQEKLEKALKYWGKDFIKKVSAGFGSQQMCVSICDSYGGYSNENGAYGLASGNTLYLFKEWDSMTAMHEITHMVRYSCEAKMPSCKGEYYKLITAANAEAIAATGKYGSAWKPEDTAYYKTSYGKTNPDEDLAMILSYGYDKSWISELKSSKPVMRAKLKAFRDYYEMYLTGGSASCALVDSILGANKSPKSLVTNTTNTPTPKPAPTPTPASTPGEGIKILAYPTKTDYKIGEVFDITGLNAVNGAGGKETNVNGKITFFIQKVNGVQLTEKSKFAVAGKKIVQLRFAGKKVGTYTINVTKDSAPTESPTNTPSPAPSEAVKILACPLKTAYKLGDGFDTTGLNAVIGEGDRETNVNGKITFYTSKTVQLTQGRKFTTTGTKVVEIRYDGKKVSAYTITVTK